MLECKKAEIVNKTPFDDFESSLALKVIDQRLTELYDLISDNHYLTRKTVDGVVELIDENITEPADKSNLVKTSVNVHEAPVAKEEKVMPVIKPTGKQYYIIAGSFSEEKML